MFYPFYILGSLNREDQTLAPSSDFPVLLSQKTEGSIQRLQMQH